MKLCSKDPALQTPAQFVELVPLGWMWLCTSKRGRTVSPKRKGFACATLNLHIPVFYQHSVIQAWLASLLSLVNCQYSFKATAAVRFSKKLEIWIDVGGISFFCLFFGIITCNFFFSLCKYTTLFPETDKGEFEWEPNEWTLIDSHHPM